MSLLETNVKVPASLAVYTRRDLIIPQLRERDTAGIISELSLLMHQQGDVPDMLPFYHTALNQELLANSALESGVALPHARLGGVKRLRFALGRAVEPVAWGTNSPWRIQLIFLLAVPATDSAYYLPLLASLARLGRMPEQLAALRLACSAREMLLALEQVPVRQAGLGVAD